MKNKIQILLGVIIFGIILLFSNKVKAYQSSSKFTQDGYSYKNGVYYDVVSGEITIQGVDTNLTNISIPSKINGLKVTEVASSAFSPTYGEKSTITAIYLPDTIVNIGDSAFSNCNNLTYVKLPKYLKHLGWGAFRDCKSLKEIKITANINEMSWFDGCSRLKKVIFTNNVTSLEHLALSFDEECCSLESLYVPDKVTDITSYLDSSHINNATIYCTENSNIALFCKRHGLKYSILDLPFFDVNKSDWYYDSVKYAYDSNIIKGTDINEFKPEDQLTRAMLVTILHRMEGMPYQSGTSKFPDVQNTSEYYYEAVKWATNNKIVSGYSNGKFGPNDPITREQLSVILNQYCRYKGKYKAVNANYGKFKDSSTISSFAKWGMNWAVGSGIINGSNGYLYPQGTATRAEASAMLSNYCKTIK